MNDTPTVTREGRVISLDAGTCAFIIRTIKPIHAEVMKELERDDLPDLLRDTLLKKRLSLEMLVHILRGNSTKKEYNQRIRKTGQLHENEVDMASYLVVADGANGELEIVEADQNELDDEVQRFQDYGYVTTIYHVVPQTGHLVDLFWPVLDAEMAEWAEKDAEVKEYLERQDL